MQSKKSILNAKLSNPQIKPVPLLIRSLMVAVRNLFQESPEQAIAHARLKAEIEQRHARHTFYRGGIL